jgi:hypothetical protein
MAHLRRGLVLSLLLALWLALNGCWVFSVYPLAASDDDLVFDKFLSGNWWNGQNHCSVSFSRLPDERMYHIVYITAKDAGDACWLGQGQSASFTGVVVELGGARFLDILPADLPLQNHMVLAHSFYRLKVDINSLSLTPMNYQTTEGLMQQEKLRGVARSDNVMALTATTKELREFIRLSATSDDVWNAAQKLEFQRRFDGQ